MPPETNSMILVLAYHYAVHNDMSEVKSGKVCILRHIDDVCCKVFHSKTKNTLKFERVTLALSKNENKN